MRTSSSRAPGQRARPPPCVLRAPVCECSSWNATRCRGRNPAAAGSARESSCGFPGCRRRSLGFRPTRSPACISKGRPAACSGCRRTDPRFSLIRRLEFDYLLLSLAREAGAEFVASTAVAQASQDAGGVTLRTRDGREWRAPIVIAADGVNSVIARRLGMNPGWPAGKLALDMMEETPVAALACRGARHAVGVLRLRWRARLRLYLPEARPRQRRHRLRAAVLQGARRPDAVRSAADVRRRSACARADEWRIAAAPLHALPDPDRRTAAQDGGRTRAARRGCRWVRQRVLGRGNLLRDGDRGARGRAPSSTRGTMASSILPRRVAPTCAPGSARSARSCAIPSSFKSTSSTALRGWIAWSAARRPGPSSRGSWSTMPAGG